MSMTPREIVHELNRHIIGQDDAKRAVMDIVSLLRKAGRGTNRRLEKPRRGNS